MSEITSVDPQSIDACADLFEVLAASQKTEHPDSMVLQYVTITH